MAECDGGGVGCGGCGGGCGVGCVSCCCKSSLTVSNDRVRGPTTGWCCVLRAAWCVGRDGRAGFSTPNMVDGACALTALDILCRPKPGCGVGRREVLVAGLPRFRRRLPVRRRCSCLLYIFWWVVVVVVVVDAVDSPVERCF